MASKGSGPYCHVQCIPEFLIVELTVALCVGAPWPSPSSRGSLQRDGYPVKLAGQSC